MSSMITQAMAEFDEDRAMIASVKEYGKFTLAVDGIGKVEEAHKQVKRLRINIPKRGKELRDGANAYCKAIIAEEKRLLDEVQPIEDALAAQRKIHDDEQERIKEEKAKVKRAILQGRIERLAEAGCVAGDIAAIELMTDDEFSLHFICERMKAESAKEQAEAARMAEESQIEAERLHNEHRQKLATRIARMEALGVAIGSAERVGQLSDEQFEFDYQVAKKAIDDRRAAEAEELRAGLEKIEADRKALEAEREAMLHQQQIERRQLEEQQAEVGRQQEEIRAEAERKAESERQRVLAERRAEDERLAKIAADEAEAARVARLEALKPEIEKAYGLMQAADKWVAEYLESIGNPVWSDFAKRQIDDACIAVGRYIERGT